MNGTYRSQSRCPPLPTQSHNLLWIGTNDGECWPAIVTLHSMVLLCPKEVKPQGSVEKLGLWFSILIQRLVKKVCRCESKYNTIQYNTIQYNTLHYTTLHYTTLHYTTLQYNTLQYNTLQYNTIQYNTI